MGSVLAGFDVGAVEEGFVVGLHVHGVVVEPVGFAAGGEAAAVEDALGGSSAAALEEAG